MYKNSVTNIFKSNKLKTPFCDLRFCTEPNLVTYAVYLLLLRYVHNYKQKCVNVVWR